MRKDFLQKLFGRKGASDAAPSVRVAAFGKHPGWNDHVEDLGIDTENLVLVKRLMYVEGIGGNIDSGAWDALDPEQLLEGFGHVFLWSFAESFVIGRMWASSDGKGRKKYPMVVAADVAGRDARTAMSIAMPALYELEKACRGTSEREPVISALERARSAAAVAMESNTNSAGGEGSASRSGEIVRLAEQQELGPGHVGLHRILYQIEREMGAYRRGTAEGSSTRIKSIDLRPQHMRVPACLKDPLESLLAWDALLKRDLDPTVPLLLVRPLEHDWIDILVGGPGTAQFFCLRAKRRAVPLATEVPYTLDEAFVARAEAWIGKPTPV